MKKYGLKMALFLNHIFKLIFFVSCDKLNILNMHRQQNKCFPQKCQIVRKTAVNCSTLQWNLTAVTNLTFVIMGK